MQFGAVFFVSRYRWQSAELSFERDRLVRYMLEDQFRGQIFCEGGEPETSCNSNQHVIEAKTETRAALTQNTIASILRHGPKDFFRLQYSDLLLEKRILLD
jgi:hypothetical protein